MRRTLAAAGLGAATVFGFAPFSLFPLPPVSLALLFLLWRRAESPRAGAVLGLAWGMGLFLAGVSWVYVSMHDVGGMPAPVAALATLLFCGVLALFPAGAGYSFCRLRSGIAGRDALLAAGAWTIYEWLRGWVLTGFPWLALGYAQTPPSPLAGYAPLFGVYGIGLIAALVAALIAFMPRRPLAWVACIVIAAGGLALSRIAWTEPAGAPTSVSLLQGDIPQSLKWDPARLRQSLETYSRLAQDNPAQLTVLPETALPMFYEDVPPQVWRALTAHGAALVGVPVHVREGYANAALVVEPGGGVPQAYAKSHLVPFGEYIPPGFAWFLDLMHIPMSDFSAGPANQQPLSAAGQRIAPDICYEDIFGEEIIGALPAATLLVNMSNTAWFGHSLAQPQHLQISRMRALETGRTVLRATNTGMTAMVRPDGSVAAVLPPFTAGALRVEAQGYAGLTPYARWGNWPAVIAAALALLPVLLRRRLTPALGSE